MKSAVRRKLLSGLEPLWITMTSRGTLASLADVTVNRRLLVFTLLCITFLVSIVSWKTPSICVSLPKNNDYSLPFSSTIWVSNVNFFSVFLCTESFCTLLVFAIIFFRFSVACLPLHQLKISFFAEATWLRRYHFFLSSEKSLFEKLINSNYGWKTNLQLSDLLTLCELLAYIYQNKSKKINKSINNFTKCLCCIYWYNVYAPVS